MRYVFAGATSATGNAVARRLVETVGPNSVTCVVRSTSDTRFLRSLGVRLHVGDVAAPESLKPVLEPSAVYLDMTHPKLYHLSLEAVVAAGVRRAVFVTTAGVFSRYRSQADIFAANEERIRNSGIVYTILRPSMIYGSSRDHNIHRLVRSLSRYPVFPLFNGGRSLMQPAYVEDIADGIASALREPISEHQEYNLAGPTAISYREIVYTILERLGRRVRTVNVSPRCAEAIVKVAQRIPGFPITEEQVLGLREDKTFDISKAVDELGYRPREFAEGIGAEIDEMRSAGVIR